MYFHQSCWIYISLTRSRPQRSSVWPRWAIITGLHESHVEYLVDLAVVSRYVKNRLGRVLDAGYVDGHQILRDLLPLHATGAARHVKHLGPQPEKKFYFWNFLKNQIGVSWGEEEELDFEWNFFKEKLSFDPRHFLLTRVGFITSICHVWKKYKRCTLLGNIFPGRNFFSLWILWF